MTSLATTTRRRAVTRPADGDLDLCDLAGRATADDAVWMHDGCGFVTFGVTARVEVADVEDALEAFSVDDRVRRPGTGPIALGALPFDAHQPAQLVIPRTVVGRSADGRCWVTEIGDGAARPRLPEAASPTRWQVERPIDRDAWRTMVLDALRAIEAGSLEKVVLARAVSVEADAPFPVGSVVARLLAQEAGCFVHHVDGLVGASPELLVRRSGRVVEARPLAGTARREVDGAARLQASAKDAHEHRLVVEDVLRSLGPLCDHLQAPAEPSPVSFASVVHLATALRGELRDGAPSALALAQRLHPTAAVAGTPRDEALRVIEDLEPSPRGRYAGPVGWVDSRGDGEWAIALRGAELTGTRAVLRAGAGIVAGSEPDAEWAETQAKLEPMLRALVTP